MFRVGQKVVCINGGVRPINGFMPVTGGVYTIRGFFRGKYDGAPRVWLDEYVHNQTQHGREMGWNALHFRPIVEKQTDISFAHEILRKVTKRERV